MERQAHGLIFEEKIEQLYGVNRSNQTYTAKWDGFMDGIPVSIKHIKKGGAIDLGDIFRQASIIEPFYMIVGFYDEANDDDIHIPYFEKNDWRQYFMPVSQFEVKFRDALNSVSNDHSDDNKWEMLMKDCKDYWKSNTLNIVRPNGKRDHKSQKRWQCSIPYSLFIKEILPKYEVK